MLISSFCNIASVDFVTGVKSLLSLDLKLLVNAFSSQRINGHRLGRVNCQGVFHLSSGVVLVAEKIEETLTLVALTENPREVKG